MNKTLEKILEDELFDNETFEGEGSLQIKNTSEGTKMPIQISGNSYQFTQEQGKNYVGGQFEKGLYTTAGILDTSQATIFRTFRRTLMPGTYYYSFNPSIRLIRAQLFKQGLTNLSNPFILEETSEVIFAFRKNYANEAPDDERTWDLGENLDDIQMQIEKGESETEYEPFTPQMPSIDFTSKIKSCGEILMPNNGKEYTQLDYIENTEAQYINLNYIPNKDTNIELDIQYLGPLNDGNKPLIGSRTNANSPDQFGFWVNGLGQIILVYGGYQAGYVEGSNATKRQILSNNKETFLIDGREVAKGTLLFGDITEWNPRFPIYLFAFNTWGRPDLRKQLARFYRLKIYEQNVLKRDFIPCIKNNDNQAGVYDLIENKFYGNTGTGDLLKSSNTGINVKICNQIAENEDMEYQEQSYSIQPQKPFRAVNDTKDTFIKQNSKWYERHVIKRIESYNDEIINSAYISSTGELSKGATVDYIADEPELIECTEEEAKILDKITKATAYDDVTNIICTDEVPCKLKVNAKISKIKKLKEQMLGIGV